MSRTNERRIDPAGISPSPHDPWKVFAVLALIEFMTVLDTSIVNVALPSIQTDLGFSATEIAWVVDAYLVAFVGFLLLGGRAADIVGRRGMFIVGVAVFTAASLGCAAATGQWMLIAARVAQGFGGALVVPSALALITDVFPEGPERNKALGIFSGMGGVAAAAGVVFGGMLTAAAWQWIFLINLPIGLGVLLCALRMLPRSRPERAGGIDVMGAVTGAGGLALLIYAVIRGSAHGWTSAAALLESGIAATLLIAFVIRQRSAEAPLIPVVLLRERTIVVGNVVIALTGALMYGMFFVITLYMQQVRGYDPFTTGLVYLPIPLIILAGTQLAPRLATRLGPHNSLVLGFVAQAVGLAWWAARIGPDRSAVLDFLAPTMLWALGAGVAVVSSFIVCTLGLTPEVAGTASGLATTSNQAGGAIGLAIIAAMADARTRSLLEGSTGADGPAALAAGYGWALWAALVIAIAAALLTRFLRLGGTPARAS